MTDARCEPPEEWRDGVARAVHDGMGDGWAYTNYAGDEWRTNRDMLNAAAVSVWKHLTSERAALRAERDAAVAEVVGLKGTVASVDEDNDALRATIRGMSASLTTLRAEVERLTRALKRLASPEAFTLARQATEEETARMCFAEAALEPQP